LVNHHAAQGLGVFHHDIDRVRFAGATGASRRGMGAVLEAEDDIA
jgi:hypothetical protein